MEQQDVIIELREMSKSFKVKNGVVHALDKIDLKINRGEIFGIIGMSGAGKSTLVRCINLLERPTEGQVLFDGQDLTVLKPADLRQARRSMGMIFQQFNLLMQKTALENVCFPLEISGVKKEEAKKRAEELLEIVGLEERKNSYPSQLSGGQKQRVAIARALTTNPKVLLCDEATSALDPNTTRSILKLLKDINKRLGITVVIITHEMSVIEEICQRVAIIDSSKIAEIGTVEKIFTAPKSNIGKQLVYSESKPKTQFDDTNKKYCRIVFEGETSFKPILANMILECNDVVNIMYANTRNIDGQAYGQMIVQLPPDDKTAKKMIAYLETQDVNFEQLSELI
ncbi:ATP-binding cassette domain-containing protein [Clostridium sp. MD294]|uniref:methionine ABC transporter ATP-binding protein n=1 Tax=Clostridium sp. MD294 TaxID=97138 RepID=UPI0002CBBDEC|nr:ATP-binding cassette domain-containing protein [Clostridium sp. MD294]NDO46728.1 ATP-binding cassette domain-containing protein [Clostridium sp. MD294]USF28831.1 Methionine import ATP-binding protein MetN [Clostridium sp. MD294]